MICVYEVGNLSKSWKKVLQHPLFFLLLDFLSAKEHVILREIKIEFPQKGIERLLEEAIDLGVIVRKNRRYSVCLPAPSEVSVSSEWRMKLQKLRERYSKVDSLMFYGMLSDCLGVIETSPIFLETADERNSSLRSLCMATRLKESGGKASYSFVYRPFSQEFSLPAVLKHITDEKELSSAEREWLELVGDVNPEYLFHCFGEIFTQFVGCEVVNFPQEDIFLRALRILGWLSKEGEKSYRLMIPLEVSSAAYEEMNVQLENFCRKANVFQLRLAISEEISSTKEKVRVLIEK